MEECIKIIDQTVNEAINIGLSNEEIEKIVLKLKKYPLEAIEISFDNFCKLNNPSFLHLIRCKVYNNFGQLKKAKRIKVKKLVLCINYKKEVLFLNELSRLLGFTRTFVQEIYVSIENASEYTQEDLKPCFKLLKRNRVNAIIYNDKKCILDPFTTFESLKKISESMFYKIEYKGNNSLGLATANSLSAIRAGVKKIYTSICGVGINNGASMEEVLLADKYFFNKNNSNICNSISEDCKEIMKKMNINIPIDKAVIGSHVFAHESGIHVDGVIKNPALYEVISPEEVGLKRRLIIGKHSGTAAIKKKFSEFDMEINKYQASEILKEVKKLAVLQKSSLSDEQLKMIYCEKIIRRVGNEINAKI